MTGPVARGRRLLQRGLDRVVPGRRDAPGSDIERLAADLAAAGIHAVVDAEHDGRISWTATDPESSPTARVEPDPHDPDQTRLVLVAHAADQTALRVRLITRADIRREGTEEVLVVGRWEAGTEPATLARAVHTRVREIESCLRDPWLSPPAINAVWWTKRANFGDLFGPILVHRITGRDVVHATYTDATTPPLFTVGSVLTFRRVPGALVWGSGLIKPLTAGETKAMGRWEPPQIFAVRGRHTREQLVRHLGWQVPEVFGDPALLAPRYLRPGPAPSAVRGRPIVIAHGIHEALFEQRPDLTDVAVPVSPTQGPQAVIDAIAGASHCVASSLHGVLTAHAYGVPWTWLRVLDQPLLGDEFKFDDFFTGLNRDQVSRIDVDAADLTADVLRRAVRKARLPEDHYDLDRLVDAFPSHLVG